MALESRQRTKTYFEWAAIRVSYKSKSRDLPNGGFVESCGRQLDNGLIQLFVGVYSADGKPITEDYTDNVQGMTVDQAIDWGFDRGLSVGNGQKPN